MLLPARRRQKDGVKERDEEDSLNSLSPNTERRSEQDSEEEPHLRYCF